MKVKHLVPTYQHDGDFLPGSQQLQPQTFRDGDQAVLALGVESVTFLVQFIRSENLSSQLIQTLRILSLTELVAASMLAVDPLVLPTRPDMVMGADESY